MLGDDTEAACAIGTCMVVKKTPDPVRSAAAKRAWRAIKYREKHWPNHYLFRWRKEWERTHKREMKFRAKIEGWEASRLLFPIPENVRMGDPETHRYESLEEWCIRHGVTR